jgi:hypothetical protein
MVCSVRVFVPGRGQESGKAPSGINLSAVVQFLSEMIRTASRFSKHLQMAQTWELPLWCPVTKPHHFYCSVFHSSV